MKPRGMATLSLLVPVCRKQPLQLFLGRSFWPKNALLLRPLLWRLANLLHGLSCTTWSPPHVYPCVTAVPPCLVVYSNLTSLFCSIINTLSFQSAVDFPSENPERLIPAFLFVCLFFFIPWLFLFQVHPWSCVRMQHTKTVKTLKLRYHQTQKWFRWPVSGCAHL